MPTVFGAIIRLCSLTTLDILHNQQDNPDSSLGMDANNKNTYYSVPFAVFFT